MGKPRCSWSKQFKAETELGDVHVRGPRPTLSPSPPYLISKSLLLPDWPLPTTTIYSGVADLLNPGVEQRRSPSGYQEAPEKAAHWVMILNDFLSLASQVIRTPTHIVMIWQICLSNILWPDADRQLMLHPYSSWISPGSFCKILLFQSHSNGFTFRERTCYPEKGDCVFQDCSISWIWYYLCRCICRCALLYYTVQYCYSRHLVKLKERAGQHGSWKGHYSYPIIPHPGQARACAGVKLCSSMHHSMCLSRSHTHRVIKIDKI